MSTPWLLGEWSWESIFSSQENLGIVCGTLMVILIVVVPMVIHYWYRLAKVKAETDLKQAMIERGMSPADIERVLAAKSPEK